MRLTGERVDIKRNAAQHEQQMKCMSRAFYVVQADDIFGWILHILHERKGWEMKRKREEEEEEDSSSLSI